jgi:hypothetical protein
MRDDDAVLVGGPLRLREKTPVGDELFTVVDPQDNVGVADIDR